MCYLLAVRRSIDYKDLRHLLVPGQVGALDLTCSDFRPHLNGSASKRLSVKKKSTLTPLLMKDRREWSFQAMVSLDLLLSNHV